MTKKIAIIGAGITGLTLAYFLNKKHPDFEIKLFEKSSRCGGKIQQVKVEDHPVSLGPKTVALKKGSRLDKLLQELNLFDQIRFASSKAKKRWIVYKGKKIAFPTSFKELFKPPFFRAIITMFFEPFKKRKKEDETVKSYFSRRFSSDLAQAIIDPVFKGIYGGGIEKLSISHTFAFAKEWERIYGSFLIGLMKEKLSPRKIFSFKDGLSTLIEALEKQAPSQIIFNSKIEKISSQQEKIYCLPIQDSFDHLFIAIDFFHLKKLIPEILHFFPQPSANSITQVVFRYKEKLNLEGFGLLIPSSEKSELLGVLFDSCIFDLNRNDFTVLTVMIDGVYEKRSRVLQIAKEGLKKYLDITEDFFDYVIESYPEAIFLKEVGHENKVHQFEQMMAEKYPHVTVLGPLMNGVSVADQIENAYCIAENFFN